MPVSMGVNAVVLPRLLMLTLVVLLLLSGVPLSPVPLGPQMTKRMGNSLTQLLTRRAVLMAAGLAGEGGGRG